MIAKNSRLVSCEWILKKKRKAFRKLDKEDLSQNLLLDALQMEGIDFKYVFSHIVKHKSIIILFAMVAEYLT